MKTKPAETGIKIHPATGGVDVAYSAQIIGGMTNGIESALEEIMEHLRRHYPDAATQAHDPYETIRCFISVIRDHTDMIKKLEN